MRQRLETKLGAIINLELGFYSDFKLILNLCLNKDLRLDSELAFDSTSRSISDPKPNVNLGLILILLEIAT